MKMSENIETQFIHRTVTSGTALDKSFELVILRKHHSMFKFGKQLHEKKKKIFTFLPQYCNAMYEMLYLIHIGENV